MSFFLVVLVSQIKCWITLVYTKIENRVKTASFESIITHLNQCSVYFKPALNSYVVIENYSKKIYDLAVTFESWDGKSLVGLVAAYFNNEKTKNGFITNVSVLREYHNSGIASSLLHNAISYARDNKYVKINLEVNINNTIAVKLYERIGFTISDSNKNNLIMVKYV